MKKENVSPYVIKRLPRYFRYLNELYANGVNRISSKELSEKMNITASQIRQDLNCFGVFGQQGYGYNIELLLGEIKSILGADRVNKAIIVGVGNIGLALALSLIHILEFLQSEYLYGIINKRIRIPDPSVLRFQYSIKN